MLSPPSLHKITPSSSERSARNGRITDVRYHYIAHTSLDAFEEHITANPKSTEYHPGLLYTMDNVAVYIMASKMKIVLALSLSDTVVKDAEVVNKSP